MNTIGYFLERYWLSVLLLIGAAAAVYLVYKNWDRIVIKGSGRK